MSDSEKEDNDEEVVDETKEEEKEEEEAEESIEFNYEQWLEELKAVLSGRDFLLHLDRLPKELRTRLVTRRGKDKSLRSELIQSWE